MEQGSDGETLASGTPWRYESGEAPPERPESEIPYENRDPLGVLLDALELPAAYPSNRSFPVIRLVSFFIPSVAIATIGGLIDRNVSLAIASALLGVQLAGPYQRLRETGLQILDKANEYQVPIFDIILYRWNEIRQARLAHHQITFTRVGPEHVSINSRTTAGANKVWARFKVRFLIEPAWNRLFSDFSRVVPRQGQAWSSPLVMRAQHRERTWRPKLPIGWHRWRCGRLIRKVGRLLEDLSLDPNASACAKTLAQQLGFRY